MFANGDLLQQIPNPQIVSNFFLIKMVSREGLHGVAWLIIGLVAKGSGALGLSSSIEGMKSIMTKNIANAIYWKMHFNRFYCCPFLPSSSWARQQSCGYTWKTSHKMGNGSLSSRMQCLTFIVWHLTAICFWLKQYCLWDEWKYWIGAM